MRRVGVVCVRVCVATRLRDYTGLGGENVAGGTGSAACWRCAIRAFLRALHAITNRVGREEADQAAGISLFAESRNACLAVVRIVLTGLTAWKTTTGGWISH